MFIKFLNLEFHKVLLKPGQAVVANKPDECWFPWEWKYPTKF